MDSQRTSRQRKRHSGQHRGGTNLLALALMGAGAYYAYRAIARKKTPAYSFYDKTVLITGGSRGLGLLLARELITEGARVALCARNSEELEEARQELTERGGEVFTISCDVTDAEDVREMIRTVQRHMGDIDVLINNAGVIQVGPMETMTHSDYEEAMNTHFWGALHTVEAVLPTMRQRKSGRIVNIASIGGKVAVPHMLPYSASKFALVGYSEGLHSELAKEGIMVTTVCPGLMRTGSHLNATFKGQNKAEYTLFSIGNALPLSSIDAAQAAKAIISACREGTAEVILSPQAALMAAFHGLFPGAFSDLMGMVNRALPGPGGIGMQKATGQESQTPLSTSLLTANIEMATLDNNERS